MKEVIGDCTLYQGDCRDFIGEIPEYQSIVTDPPYGIGDMVGGYGRAGRTIANDGDLSVCHDVINSLWGRYESLWMVAFYSCRVTPEFMFGMPHEFFYGDIIWDKAVPGMGAGIRYQHENAAVFRKGDIPVGDTIFSVIRQQRVADVHPHEKPTGLMVRLCQLTSGVVIDPFMGSGSTGAACARLGRPFVGVELSSEHFDSACKKIEEEYKNGDMFYESIDEQGSLL